MLSISNEQEHLKNKLSLTVLTLTKTKKNAMYITVYKVLCGRIANLLSITERGVRLSSSKSCHHSRHLVKQCRHGLLVQTLDFIKATPATIL